MGSLADQRTTSSSPFADPAFRARATITVAGGGGDTPTLVGLRFEGRWNVAGGGFGVNCSVGLFGDFNNGGVIRIIATGETGQLVIEEPAGIQSYFGRFAVTPDGGSFGSVPIGSFGIGFDPQDPDAFGGFINLRAGNRVPCHSFVVGERQ